MLTSCGDGSGRWRAWREVKELGADWADGEDYRGFFVRTARRRSREKWSGATREGGAFPPCRRQSRERADLGVASAASIFITPSEPSRRAGGRAARSGSRCRQRALPPTSAGG
jgi:hypothetical protein